MKGLILCRILRFAIETSRMKPDDFNIPAVAIDALQMCQISERSPLQKGRTILVDAIKPGKEFCRKRDGCLDSHKTIILPAEVLPGVLPIHG